MLSYYEEEKHDNEQEEKDKRKASNGMNENEDNAEGANTEEDSLKVVCTRVLVTKTIKI